MEKIIHKQELRELYREAKRRGKTELALTILDKLQRHGWLDKE